MSAPSPWRRWWSSPRACERHPRTRRARRGKETRERELGVERGERKSPRTPHRRGRGSASRRENQGRDTTVARRLAFSSPARSRRTPPLKASHSSTRLPARPSIFTLAIASLRHLRAATRPSPRAPSDASRVSSLALAHASNSPPRSRTPNPHTTARRASLSD